MKDNFFSESVWIPVFILFIQPCQIFLSPWALGPQILLFAISLNICKHLPNLFLKNIRYNKVWFIKNVLKYIFRAVNKIIKKKKFKVERIFVSSRCSPLLHLNQQQQLEALPVIETVHTNSMKTIVIVFLLL